MKRTFLIALLLTISLDSIAGGFRTSSSGNVYYCDSCVDSHRGNRIDITVPPGTSQREIDRLVKKALADFYRIQASYIQKKGAVK